MFRMVGQSLVGARHIQMARRRVAFGRAFVAGAVAHPERRMGASLLRLFRDDEGIRVGGGVPTMGSVWRWVQGQGRGVNDRFSEEDRRPILNAYAVVRSCKCGRVCW